MTPFEEAKSVFVGGVNSPVRAFKSVGGEPIFFDRGEGSHLVDLNGKSYIDYVGSWGPLLLGHAHSQVISAITQAAQKGCSFGAPHLGEIALARLVQYFYPSMEKIRFVSSGTEATMAAIRLARGATGRSKILKFSGCYHGHADSLLVAAGSGASTLAIPDSAGVPASFAAETLVVGYNDIAGVKAIFSAYGHEIAGVIVEPVCGNMGLLLPQPGFLETLRHCCDQYESILIFDEVMCGFRVHRHGAQGLYGIKPDLTCLGKVIGGGLPCAAFGGRDEIMKNLAPEGPVYQAGTLSGNPVAMAAGIATLTTLKDTPAFEQAVAQTDALVSGFTEQILASKLPVTLHHLGTMFCLFFHPGPLISDADVRHCDLVAFRAYYHHMLDRGIYLAPSQFETNFMSAVHTDKDIQKTLTAFQTKASFD